MECTGSIPTKACSERPKRTVAIKYEFQGSSSDIRTKAESLEDLAEETILAILTELSSSSPEAQALLDDVYRQVEQIRRRMLGRFNHDLFSQYVSRTRRLAVY